MVVCISFRGFSFWNREKTTELDGWVGGWEGKGG